MVLQTPFFLNGMPLPPSAGIGYGGIAFSVAVFGLGLSLLYLFVFNRPTRQSLHDIIVGSYVVRVGTERLLKPRIWPFHFVVVACIFLAAAAVPLGAARLAKQPFFQALLPAYNAVATQPEVAVAQVFAGSSFFWDPSRARQSRSYVLANIRLNQRISDKQREANKIAHIILDKYADAMSHDVLVVNVTEGYDIGIASWFSTQRYQHTPREWQSQPL